MPKAAQLEVAEFWGGSRASALNPRPHRWEGGEAPEQGLSGRNHQEDRGQPLGSKSPSFTPSLPPIPRAGQRSLWGESYVEEAGWVWGEVG